MARFVSPVSLAFVSLAVAVASPASARDRSRGAMEVSFRLTLQHMPSLPGGTLNEESGTDLRYYPSSTKIALGNPMTFVGAEAGFAFTFGDRWLFPFLNVGIHAPVGPTPDVLTGVDGSLGRVSPSSAYRLDVGFVGFGFRQNDRRFSYGMRVMPYFSIMPALDTEVLEGNTFVPIARTRVMWFSVRFEGEACRRLDPSRRACLVLSPSIFEGRWLNGLALSLKMELGS